MRLLPIALGLPGTIGFPTAIAHHRSPHRQVTEVSYAGKNIIAYHPSHGNSAPTSRMDCFVDSLLGGGKARQHLAPEALDGLQGVGERHAWPLAAHDEFLHARGLIPRYLGSALCGAADNESVYEYLLERHVDAVGDWEQAVVPQSDSVLVQPLGVWPDGGNGLGAAIGHEHLSPGGGVA